MGISVKTLQRRAQLWGMRSFTDVTNPEVDEMVREFKVNFPNSGEAVLRGYLESRGVHIQRERVRQAVWRINGNEPRLHPPIARRTYSVSGPNALWHIDGNHKLIKWRLVIHGGIDGFSRVVTFLKCSNNNRSDTVLTEFVSATCEFAIPSRVSSDLGGKNVGVWRFMEEGLNVPHTLPAAVLIILESNVCTAVTYRFVTIVTYRLWLSKPFK